MARVQFGTEGAANSARERSKIYVPAPSLSARPGSPVQLLRKLFLRIDHGEKLTEKLIHNWKNQGDYSSKTLTLEQLNQMKKENREFNRLMKLIPRMRYSGTVDFFKEVLDPRHDPLVSVPYRVMDLTKMFLERKNEPTK